MQEEELAEEALRGLQEIARTLTTSAYEGPLPNYLKPIAKECNEHLEDAPTKQSSAAGRILSSIARASPEVSNWLTRAVLPQLLALYSSADSLPRRRGLLEVLNQFMEANLVCFGKWRNTETTATGDLRPATRLGPNALEEYSDQCASMLMGSIVATPVNEVSFRLLAMNGLSSLVMVKGVLDDVVITKIIGILVNIVIAEESYGKDETKAAAIDSLVDIARQKPQLVIENAIPAFIGRLPDSDNEPNTVYVPVLEAFAKLSVEQQLFSTVIIRLKNQLNTALRQDSSPQYVLAVLSAILYAFTRGAVDLSNAAIFGQLYTDMVSPLIQAATTSPAKAMNDDAVLDTVGRICNTIIQPQPWVSQVEICRNTYTLFRQVDITKVPPFVLQPESSKTLAISTHLIASLHREAKPHTDMPALLHALIATVADPATPTSTRTTVLVQVSLIVSKYLPAATTSTVLLPILLGPTSLLSQPALTPHALRTAFAILKPLVLRTDPLLAQLIPTYLSLLADATHGPAVARALGALLAPSDLLTKRNHCVIYALHPQRFFALTVPALTAAYATTPPAQAAARANILTALSGILTHIPYSLLRPDLPALLPPLLQSLALHDAPVAAGAIATLSRVLIDDAAALHGHVGALVTRLLDVACPTPGAARPAAASPRLRVAALACLNAFVGALRAELLLPQRRTVIRRLAAALDDAKRAVRAEAVRCRAAWLGLGEPEE